MNQKHKRRKGDGIPQNKEKRIQTTKFKSADGEKRQHAGNLGPQIPRVPGPGSAQDPLQIGFDEIEGGKIESIRFSVHTVWF